MTAWAELKQRIEEFSMLDIIYNNDAKLFAIYMYYVILRRFIGSSLPPLQTPQLQHLQP